MFISFNFLCNVYSSTNDSNSGNGVDDGTVDSVDDSAVETIITGKNEN